MLEALFGGAFGLLNWIDPIVSGLALALYGMVFGAVLGAVLGLIGHALTGGRHDFSSPGAMTADSYDLLVDREVADQAVHLRQTPAAPGQGRSGTKPR